MLFSEYKIVVCGPGGVGKSCLTNMLVVGLFTEEYDPTIEDSYRKQVSVDGEVGVIDILDTAGQEEYSAMLDEYLRRGQGFVIVYSVTAPDTFKQVAAYKKRIQRTHDGVASPIIVVGNKSDLKAKRLVSTEEGANMAEDMGALFIEASAKDNINVEEAFYQLVRAIREQRRERNEEAPKVKAPGKDMANKIRRKFAFWSIKRTKERLKRIFSGNKLNKERPVSETWTDSDSVFENDGSSDRRSSLDAGAEADVDDSSYSLKGDLRKFKATGSSYSSYDPKIHGDENGYYTFGENNENLKDSEDGAGSLPNVNNFKLENHHPGYRTSSSFPTSERLLEEDEQKIEEERMMMEDELRYVNVSSSDPEPDIPYSEYIQRTREKARQAEANRQQASTKLDVSSSKPETESKQEIEVSFPEDFEEKEDERNLEEKQIQKEPEEQTREEQEGRRPVVEHEISFPEDFQEKQDERKLERESEKQTPEKEAEESSLAISQKKSRSSEDLRTENLAQRKMENEVEQERLQLESQRLKIAQQQLQLDEERQKFEERRLTLQFKQQQYEKQKKDLEELPIGNNLEMKSQDFSQPWFFGDITAEDAERLLSDKPRGTFLIRTSSQSGCYAVSFIGEHDKLEKALIISNENGFAYSTTHAEFYPTLTHLVEASGSILTTPLQRIDDTARGAGYGRLPDVRDLMENKRREE